MYTTGIEKGTKIFVFEGRIGKPQPNLRSGHEIMEGAHEDAFIVSNGSHCLRLNKKFIKLAKGDS